MTVAGSSDAGSIKLDDVLVGDVWVASGQSNMEFAMRQAATADADLPHAGNPNIRLLIVKKKAIEYPQDDVELDAGWAASTPETAKDFSAVAWYFAREIEGREHVPVGVIDATWGGTVAEAWTRMAALGADAALAPLFVSWGRMTERESDAPLVAKDQQWQRGEAMAQGKPEPQFPWHPQLDTWGPAMLYNGMIAPLTPFPIRGVIWYQGESNSALARAPRSPGREQPTQAAAGPYVQMSEARSALGPTAEQALNEVEKAKELWLDAARAAGKPRSPSPWKPGWNATLSRPPRSNAGIPSSRI